MSFKRNTLGWIAIIGSILLIFISLAADLIGIGSYPGIHWAQLTGAGIGLIALILAIWFHRSGMKS